MRRQLSKGVRLGMRVIVQPTFKGINNSGQVGIIPTKNFLKAVRLKSLHSYCESHTASADKGLSASGRPVRVLDCSRGLYVASCAAELEKNF